MTSRQQTWRGALLLFFTLSFSFGLLSPALGEEGPRRDFLELHNEARGQARECGEHFLSATSDVEWSEALAQAAVMHARDLAFNQHRGHTGSDGSSPMERVQRISRDYFRIGENIAYYNVSAERAMEAWLNSPGHCSNIMGGGYTHMGAAMIRGREGQNRAYWVVLFGGRRGEDSSERLSANRRPPTAEEIAFLKERSILMYGSDRCVRTIAAREELESHGIDFVFKPTNDDPEARSEMFALWRRASDRGSRLDYPVMDIGGEVVHGRMRAADMVMDIRGYAVEYHGDPNFSAASSQRDYSNQYSLRSRDSIPEEGGVGSLRVAVGPGVGGVINEDRSGPAFRGSQIYLQGQFTLPIYRARQSRSFLEPGLFLEVGMGHLNTVLPGALHSPQWNIQGGFVYQEWFRLGVGLQQQATRQADGLFAEGLTNHLSFTLGGVQRWTRFQVEVYLGGLVDLENEDIPFLLGLTLGYVL